MSASPPALLTAGAGEGTDLRRDARRWRPATGVLHVTAQAAACDDDPASSTRPATSAGRTGGCPFGSGRTEGTRWRWCCSAERGTLRRVRVDIDASRCQGHGRCYELAPRVFGEDDEGYGVVRVHEVGADQQSDVRLADLNCPEGAVLITADAP